MKISELLKQNRRTLSFEVFPPKTDTGLDDVRRAAERIAALGPAFISVTYGAGGNGSRYTLEIARHVQGSYGIPALAHLTCVGMTKSGAREAIGRLQDAGIENVMALRGDLPAGMTPSQQAAGDYPHASDLIAELKAEGFCVGGACYPEIHPESASQADDLAGLRRKAEAGCDFLTTQMFFDNDVLYSFLYRLRESGVFLPVLPGVMPITNAGQLDRALRLSQAFMPQRFRRLVDRFGSDPAAMRQAGVVYAAGQAVDLYASGIQNVHVYTMNKPEVAEGILGSLSSLLG
ncbi:MAG: methylenetetrahydrofolate reductase [Clostridia bacterium]|nr:methylenetetrahydrofolate reductase [Clostridia bacterium]